MAVTNKQSALQSIIVMGTNAAPVLIEVMGWSPEQLDQWQARLQTKNPGVAQGKMSQRTLRSRTSSAAQEALISIPEATSYVTNFFPLLQDSRSEVRNVAATSLAYFSHQVDGELLLPALPALKDKDPLVRTYILKAFRLAATIPEVRTALEEVLLDAREDLRREAANALLRADKNHARALATLKSLFTSTDAHTRYFAVRDYINSDPIRPRTEKELIPVLINMLSDDDVWTQRNAANSLGEFGPRGLGAVSQLQKLLQSADPDVRRSATNALSEIAPGLLPGKPAAPADREVVLQHLQNLYTTNQAFVFQSVKAMGTNAVPLLIEILGYETTQMDQWYEKAYAKAPASVKSRMSKPEALEKLRSQTSLLLLNMPETGLYLTNLLSLLKDERVEVRRRAASLVQSCIANNRQRLEDGLMLECLPALRDSDHMVRLYMVHAFSPRWAVIPRAKAALEAVLNDQVEEVRVAAAAILLQTDGNHQTALQALKALFTSTNATYRHRAAAYYLSIGSPKGRLEDEMIPIFISTLSGSDKDQLISASGCLERFGPRAKAAVPVLLKHAQSTEPEVQQAARNALEKIAPEVLSPRKP